MNESSDLETFSTYAIPYRQSYNKPQCLRHRAADRFHAMKLIFASVRLWLPALYNSEFREEISLLPRDVPHANQSVQRQNFHGQSSGGAGPAPEPSGDRGVRPCTDHRCNRGIAA